MKEEQLAMNFWGRIEQAQTEENKLSLKNLCKSIGAPYQTIINQKSSARLPSLIIAIKLAEELNRPIDWLLFGDKKNNLNVEPAQLFKLIASDARKLAITERVATLSQTELFAIEVFLGIRK